MTFKNTLMEALETFGEQRQLNQFTEEASEAIIAINKYRRNPNEKTKRDLVEELIDCEIMIAQLYIMLDVRATDANKLMDVKLLKLRHHIQKEISKPTK